MEEKKSNYLFTVMAYEKSFMGHYNEVKLEVYALSETEAINEAMGLVNCKFYKLTGVTYYFD